MLIFLSVWFFSGHYYADISGVKIPRSYQFFFSEDNPVLETETRNDVLYLKSRFSAPARLTSMGRPWCWYGMANEHQTDRLVWLENGQLKDGCNNQQRVGFTHWSDTASGL